MKAEVNGMTLNYQLGGSGRLIAMAHSLGMSGAIFDSIRPKLEPHGRVLTWDARGHGKSQGPATSWSVEDLERYFRDSLGPAFERPSMGGGPYRWYGGVGKDARA